LEVLKLQVQFNRLLQVRYENRFNELRSYVATQAKWAGMGSGLMPDESTKAELKQAQWMVKLGRGTVAMLEDKLKQLTGPTYIDDRNDWLAERSAEADKFVEFVNDVRI
jgi:hypothetical protein